MSASGDPREGMVPIIGAIFLLMLPVTGVVPVLEELTGGRHPELSDFAKHLFMVSNMLAALLIAPIAGYFSDRLGHRRPVIIAVMLANAVVLTALSLDAPYAVHLILRFFDGALHITALTLLMTMAMDRAHIAGTGRAMGAAGAALTLGVATGAPVGGFIGQFGATHVLLAGAALSILLAAWVTGLTADTRGRAVDHQASWLKVRDLPWHALSAPYVFTFADRLSVGFIVSTMTLYLRTVLGAEPVEIGLLMGSFMLPFAILTYGFGRMARLYEPLAMMFIGSLAYGVILVVLAFAALPAWWLLMPLGGVSAALMFAPSLILTARAADARNRATAMGGFHAAGSFGFLLGPLVGGGVLAVASLFGHSGWTAAFIIIASIQWICVAVFLPRLLR